MLRLGCTIRGLCSLNALPRQSVRKTFVLLFFFTIFLLMFRFGFFYNFLVNVSLRFQACLVRVNGTEIRSSTFKHVSTGC